MDVWKLVQNVTRDLDEAAGLSPNPAGGPPDRRAVGSTDEPAGDGGWDADSDDLDFGSPGATGGVDSDEAVVQATDDPDASDEQKTSVGNSVALLREEEPGESRRGVAADEAPVAGTVREDGADPFTGTTAESAEPLASTVSLDAATPADTDTPNAVDDVVEAPADVSPTAAIAVVTKHSNAGPNKSPSTPEPEPQRASGAATLTAADDEQVQVLTAQVQRLSAELSTVTNERNTLEQRFSAARSKIKQLQQAVQDARSQALSARQGPTERESELEAEGRALAAEVGRERERVKTLVAEKAEMEKDALEVLNELDAMNAKEEQAAESRELLLAERDRLTEQLAEMRKEQTRQAADAQTIQHSMDDLRSKLIAQRSEIAAELEATQKQLTAESAKHEVELGDAEGQIASLKAEVTRTIVQCEERIGAAEREIASLSARAHAAEARGVELTHSAAVASTDQRTENDRLEAQAQAAVAARRMAEVQVAALQKELAGAREESRVAEKLVAERQQQQTQQLQALKADFAQLQRTVERERARNDALSRRNDELTTEAARHVAQAASSAQQQHEARQRQEPASESRKLVDPNPTSGAQLLDGLLHGGSASSGAARQTKVERALAQVTIDLAQLKKQHAAQAEELAAVRVEHDVLLQMYGQQSEEMADLQGALEAAQARLASAS